MRSKRFEDYVPFAKKRIFAKLYQMIPLKDILETNVKNKLL
jgi:hypothetical protein